MATNIKIGHASISEHGTASGTAGDTGDKEVYIRDNYSITNLSPYIVLRPKTSTIAKASATACEKGCNNSHIGYSQNGRNTLNTLAAKVDYDLSEVSTDCNTDCSAFMTVCAIAGGARISYGTNAPTTTNMRTRFKQSGDYIVLTDTKHTTATDYLKRGDILVKEGSHTVMVLENGSRYADEDDDIDDPSISTGITKTRTIRTYALDVSTSNIKDTSAVITFSVIESKNNIEKILTNTSKWTYYLTLKALPSLSEIEYKFTSNKLNLTGLTSGSSYLIKVSAKKSDDKVAFCSAYKLITTTKKGTQDSKQKVELVSLENTCPCKPVDKVYIRDNNTYKQAIVYKNT